MEEFILVIGLAIIIWVGLKRSGTRSKDGATAKPDERHKKEVPAIPEESSDFFERLFGCLFYFGLPLLALFLLVKFIKWAWQF